MYTMDFFVSNRLILFYVILSYLVKLCDILFTGICEKPRKWGSQFISYQQGKGNGYPNTRQFFNLAIDYLVNIRCLETIDIQRKCKYSYVHYIVCY